MKKILYTAPLLRVKVIGSELPVAQSNLVNGNSVNINSSTMTEGNGSDAVKSNQYNVWDDDWSK